MTTQKQRQANQARKKQYLMYLKSQQEEQEKLNRIFKPKRITIVVGLAIREMVKR